MSGKVVGSDLDGSVAVESNSTSGSVHIRDSSRFQAASARLELSVVLYASAFETNRTSGSAPASAVVGGGVSTVNGDPRTGIQLQSSGSMSDQFNGATAGSGGSVLSAASTGTAQQIGYEIVAVFIAVLRSCVSGLNSVLTIRAAGAIIAVLPRAPLAGSFAMPVAN